MTTYSYAAVDAQGRETRGTIQVANQAEALQRIKEMGFFPVKIAESRREPLSPAGRVRRHGVRLSLTSRAAMSVRKPRGRVKSRQRPSPASLPRYWTPECRCSAACAC